jgi:hypothetical protein
MKECILCRSVTCVPSQAVIVSILSGFAHIYLYVLQMYNNMKVEKSCTYYNICITNVRQCEILKSCVSMYVQHPEPIKMLHLFYVHQLWFQMVSNPVMFVYTRVR